MPLVLKTKRGQRGLKHAAKRIEALSPRSINNEFMFTREEFVKLVSGQLVTLQLLL